MIQEVPTTVQKPEMEVGVMGYPEKACPETGAKIEKEILDNAIPALAAAIAAAAENRASGKKVIVEDNEKLKILAL
jgi:hypothetical protein